MKLTVEQKQLLHECVDLALEIEVKGFLFETNTTSANVFLGIYRKDANEVARFNTHQLQKAKDLLTKILEK